MPRILVVEDYDSLQDIYKTALMAAGYDVDVAADGLDALELTKKREPDLIVLDMLLPHMGGLEFLRAYDLSKHPKVKVVIFSNLYSPKLLEESRALGVKHYLTKSDMTLPEMIDAVGKALAEDQPDKKGPKSK